MVTLYDINGDAIRAFRDVLSFSRTFCEFTNGWYRGRIYANTEAGESFDDPDDPIPAEPEQPEVSSDADAILRELEGVAAT